MSSKKSNQKPATPKPEAETVEGVTETQAPETTEETAGAELTEAPPAEPTADEPGDTPDSAPADGQETQADPAAAGPEAPAVISTVAEAPATPVPAAASQDGLSIRLTQVVRAIATTGKPEAVHALHKAELIVGDLKNALPAAIAAAGDEQLKADLTSLLAVL